MSFSFEIKNELVKTEIKNTCCATAELAGIVCFAGVLGSDGILKITNENVLVTNRTFNLAAPLDGVHLNLPVEKVDGSHTVFVTDYDVLLKLLKISGLDGDNIKKFIAFKIDKNITKKKCCKKAFLRGAFLVSGSVSHPEKSYHFEIVTHHYILSRDLCHMLAEMGFKAKIAVRKSNYMIYFKDSNCIADLLTVMGAHSSLMAFENVRILKEVRNNVNRVVNCETGNLQKTAVAAANQLMSIEFINKNIGFEALPDSLKEIAQLRLMHREASLKELGEMLSVKISKSGVNHRLKKLEHIAEVLRSRQTD